MNNLFEADNPEFLIDYLGSQYDLLRETIIQGKFRIGLKILHTSHQIYEWMSRAIEENNLPIVEVLLMYPQVDSYDFIDSVVKFNHPEIINMFLNLPDIDLHKFMESVISYDRLDVMDKLLNLPHYQFDDGIIYYISKSGSVSILQRILRDPRVEPFIESGAILEAVVCYGSVDQIKCLLQDSRIDITFNNHSALYLTATSKYGFEDIIQDPRVDPAADNNRVLWRIMNNIRSVVNQVYKFNDPEGLPMDGVNLLRNRINVLLQDPRVFKKCDPRTRVLKTVAKEIIGDFYDPEIHLEMFRKYLDSQPGTLQYRSLQQILRNRIPKFKTTEIIKFDEKIKEFLTTHNLLQF